MTGIIEKARMLAHEKHGGQFMRGATKLPAITHIAEVAAFVVRYGGTDEMIAAAWLHDTVEDTDLTIEDIRETFGEPVASYVDGLTDPPDFEAMPLHVRKPRQAERLAAKCDEVKKIKICDQLSNTLRVLSDPPLDWNREQQFTYIKGAKAIVDVSRGLWPDADRDFDRAYQQACETYKDVQ